MLNTKKKQFLFARRQRHQNLITSKLCQVYENFSHIRCYELVGV